MAVTPETRDRIYAKLDDALRTVARGRMDAKVAGEYGDSEPFDPVSDATADALIETIDALVDLLAEIAGPDTSGRFVRADVEGN